MGRCPGGSSRAVGNLEARTSRGDRPLLVSAPDCGALQATPRRSESLCGMSHQRRRPLSGCDRGRSGCQSVERPTAMETTVGRCGVRSTWLVTRAYRPDG
jgi:hypothetical protein